MKFFHWILDQFPYVKRAKATITALTGLSETHKSTSLFWRTQCEAEKREHAKTAQQGEDRKTEIQFLFEQLKEAESREATLRTLNAKMAGELLEWRERVVSVSPAPTLPDAPASVAKVEEMWTCSCGKRQAFYTVSCEVCMRTRPPRKIP